MSIRTREQERALRAYGCVEEVLRRPPTLHKEYKALANGLGSQVLRNGLAAALAFLERRLPDKGKEENAEGLLVAHLWQYVREVPLPGLKEAKDWRELPAAVRSLGLEEYMLATRELLRFSVWLRRAVQASLGEGQ